MLLQALYEYARDRNLLARLPFQRRVVHLLVPLRKTGEVRGHGFVPLFTPIRKGKKTKEEPGREFLLPRFPGVNNGGKSYYLAENFTSVFGLRKTVGETLPLEPKSRQDRNPVGAFCHFWQRIAQAHARTQDERLAALLAFRDRYLPAVNESVGGFEWVEWRTGNRSDKAEWFGRTNTGEPVSLAKMGTVAFQFEEQLLVVPDEGDPLADPLWRDWVETYTREADAEPDEPAEEKDGRETICLVTGQTGEPVARSHKLKILGVPGLASGGYVVSFAREAPAFSSFGFEMGANAPVSQTAAAGYALALNELLAGEDTSFRVGEVVLCFWAGKRKTPSLFREALQADPRNVADFLKRPFTGIERELARQEDFFSVALSANAGRVVVRQWLRVTLEEAIENLARWFQDLEIASLGDSGSADKESQAGPYGLFRLGAALIRNASKQHDELNDAITILYRSALTGAAPPVRFLAPLLATFRSALVGDAPRKPRYPFNVSRFALLKLILLRNRNPRGGFMPTPHLADTDDAAYNLGRLFWVLASLQDQAHEYKLEGPGIVERYYGAASSAPASTFAVLWNLHNHHLRKLEQQGDKGQRAAFAIRGRIADLVASIPPDGPGQPPRFPAQLTLEEQGRFALGFYQQMAADRHAVRAAAGKAATTTTP